MAKIPKLGRVTGLERGTGANKELFYAGIEWIDEEGYRVHGELKLIGWAQAPRAIGEKAQAALSKPPLVVYHGRSRKGAS